MKPRWVAAAALTAALASAAFAHPGVKDTQVLERMKSMKAMGEALKVVGHMVRGETEFDADEAARAVERLRAEVEATPALFEARATDPKMGAAPDLWDNWQDFVSRNDALAATLAKPAPETPEAAQRWLAEVGRACAACHENHRQ